jgi:hypothetical protein
MRTDAARPTVERASRRPNVGRRKWPRQQQPHHTPRAARRRPYGRHRRLVRRSARVVTSPGSSAALAALVPLPVPRCGSARAPARRLLRRLHRGGGHPVRGLGARHAPAAARDGRPALAARRGPRRAVPAVTALIATKAEGGAPHPGGIQFVAVLVWRGIIQAPTTASFSRRLPYCSSSRRSGVRVCVEEAGGLAAVGVIARRLAGTRAVQPEDRSELTTQRNASARSGARTRSRSTTDRTPKAPIRSLLRNVASLPGISERTARPARPAPPATRTCPSVTRASFAATGSSWSSTRPPACRWSGR